MADDEGAGLDVLPTPATHVALVVLFAVLAGTARRALPLLAAVLVGTATGLLVARFGDVALLTGSPDTPGPYDIPTAQVLTVAVCATAAIALTTWIRREPVRE